MDPYAIILIVGGIILFAVILVALDNSPSETQRYPDLKNNVIFFSHECGNITWFVKNKKHSISLSPSESMDRPGLQKKVAKYVDRTPIQNKLRITNYAWDLVELFTEYDLLPKNWEPVGAYSFCNGVVMIRYMEKIPEKGKPNAAVKDLYFNANDGHLIYFKK